MTEADNESGVSRRRVLSALLSSALGGALALSGLDGCASAPKPQPAQPDQDLVTNRDLLACVSGSGLRWVIRAKLREIAAAPQLAGVLAEIFPEARLSAFAAAHGGVDLRQLKELVVADYGDATLYAARGVFDPARIEAALQRRGEIEGRAVDLAHPPIVRAFGNVGDTRVQLATFGREAVALEAGRFGPLRAFEAFSEGKLKRSRPAIAQEPLVGLAERRLPPGELLALAPGPFEGEWKGALGGLLGACTGAGLSVALAGKTLRVRLVLLGAFGNDAPAAAERLSAATNVICQNALGRLLGLDAPVEPPTVSAAADALTWGAAFQVEKLGAGIHTALDAHISEIMR